VKPNMKSIEVHPQLSNNCHPVDGALVGVGSLWPTKFDSLTNFGLFGTNLALNLTNQ
jgi:hypothetical protein